MDDISSGDEDDDDVDGIEIIRPQQICDDPDCDHTSERTQCKNQFQTKVHKIKKKSKKRKKPTEWCSSFYKWAHSLIYQFFCVSISNTLGKWRFTRSLEWYSTAKYVNRLFMIGEKVNSCYLVYGVKYNL